jgi:streptomycin 6-kinase
MDATPLAISPRLSAYAQHLGEDGQAWLAELPDLIAELETRWSITVGEPLPEAGEGYVAWAKRTDGTPAVLKLTVPRPHRRNEIEILARANGNGYALLLEADRDRYAMLLEALGPMLSNLHLPPEQSIRAQTAALQGAWKLPIDETTLWFGEQKATALADLIERNWNEFGKPCSRTVVDQALRFAERRAAAHDPERCVYAHGDPHADNALQVPRPRAGAESGFVFIDPDGGAIEPAYDLGVILRDWDAELAAANDPLAFAQTICSHLAESTGVERQAIWEWGFIERVATGLYVLEFGQTWGLEKLASAEHLLQAD